MTKKALDQLPNRAREWRLRRGLTLQEVGEAAGTTKSHLQRMEVGTRELTLNWMQRISAALGVSAADLLCDEDNPHRLSAGETQLILQLRGKGSHAIGIIQPLVEALPAKL